MTEKKKAADTSRLGFVDDARGLAVVLMIFWHTVDGWLHPAHKVGQGYQTMVSFGGLAAPMFLFLAGAGAALKIAADAARGTPKASTVRELVCRGLEVVVSGYALRVFMWVVDGTAITEPRLAPAFVPLALGLLAMYVGLGKAAKLEKAGFVLVAAGAATWALGWQQTIALAPEQVNHLARVDVLQTIGFSLVLIALTEPLVRYAERPALGVIVGFALAAVTGLLERDLPGDLPPGIAAYLGRWPTGVGPSIAMFPLFPWVGYAATGTAVGIAWFRGERAGKTALTVLAVACVGALIGSLTNENIRFTFAALKHAPELARALRMLQKIGFALALSGALFVITQRLGRFPLRTLGNTSMFIYWVHLELVYGIVAKGLAHRLSLGVWALSFIGLSLAMAVVAEGRVRLPRFFKEMSRPKQVLTREG